MSQWEANPQLDYSATGDDIDTASQKIIQMFNDVYEKLNRLRTMDASASHSVGDAEPFSFKIDTSVNPPALLCRNAAGTGYVQVGSIAENFGIDAAALNLIASDGNIGSIKLGQEANLPATATTYDLYFAYDTGRLYMFLTGAWRVFLSLRFEDLLGVGNAVIERGEVAANGANKIPRLNEVGQGEFDITGSAAKIGGKNLYLPEIPDGCVLVFNATRDRWEVAARDDITTDDVSTTGEPNKIVKADANGAIQNDTKGNAAKIATKTIDVSNLQDGDVLVYDATTGTFKNKQGAVVNAQGVVEANVSGSAQKWAGKAIQTVNMTDGQILVWSESLNAFINRNQSAVGNARALSLRQDGVELANYNGDEYRAVNIITPHLRVGGQAYTVGQTCYSKNMPMTTYLECVTAGVTAGVEPDFSTAAIGDVVADGGAEWKVCSYVNSEVTDALNTRLAREEAITAHDYRQPSTTYAVGNIAYNASLPTGWYLECTTAGMTGSGELTISSPSINGTVSDGTVVWVIRQTASTKNLTGFLVGNLKTDTNIISSNDDKYITIIGGDNSSDSPFIFMNGNNGDGAAVKGRIVLNAQNLTESTTLILDPNGGLLLDNSLHDAADLGGSAIVAKSLSTNGYIKYASGLIVQWKAIDVNSAPANDVSIADVTWPISFPTSIFGAIANTRSFSRSRAGYASLSELTTSGVKVIAGNTYSSTQNINISILAYGK